MPFSTPVSAPNGDGGPLLAVRDLCVAFRTESGGLTRAVEGVSFTVERGEILGLVGESGSGKTQTLLSLMGLIEDPNAVVTGSVSFEGREILGLPRRALRRIRGARIAMIFQDPMTSLTPVHTIGAQIAEQIRAHRAVPSRNAGRRAVDLLAAVGIPDPGRVAGCYPHQLSGGMRQRAVIAMALSCDPALLVADEPTTALDVTVQAQILKLLEELRTNFGSSIVIVTHDLGVVAELADRVMVMYSGRIVEQGQAAALFAEPRHPYTWGLCDSIPPLIGPRPRRLLSIPGMPPSLTDKPPGCAFAPRCSYVKPICHDARPALEPLGQGLSACFLTAGERALRQKVSP